MMTCVSYVILLHLPVQLNTMSPLSNQESILHEVWLKIISTLFCPAMGSRREYLQRASLN